SYHGPVVYLVGEAHPRSKSLVIGILRPLPAVASRTISKVSIGAEDVARTRIGERGIHRGEAVKCLCGGDVIVIPQAKIQRQLGSNLVGVLGIKRQIFVTNPAKCTVIENPAMHQAKECGGNGISATKLPRCTARISCRTRLRRVKVELARGSGEAADVKLQSAEFTAKLDVVLALDPAHRIIDLIDIVCKLRVAAIVEHLEISGGVELDARESCVLYALQPELLWIILTDAVRQLTPETAAEPDQEVVQHIGAENVVMTEAGVPCVLRSMASLQRILRNKEAGIGIVPVKSIGEPLLVRDHLVDLQVPEVGRRLGLAALKHVIGQTAVGGWKQAEDLAHNCTSFEVRIVGKIVSGNLLVRNRVEQQGVAEPGEVAPPERFVGIAEHTRGARAEAESLIVEHEERLVVAIVDSGQDNRT